MCIIHILPAHLPKEKRRSHCRREKKSPPIITRETVMIGSKPHYIVSVPHELARSSALLPLLRAYRGRILMEEGFENDPFFGAYLFSGRRETVALCFDAFLKTIAHGEASKRSLCVKDLPLVCGERYLNLVPLVGKLTIITEDEHFFLTFPKLCYKEYGCKPFVSDAVPQKQDYDIFIDLDAVTPDSGLTVWQTEKVTKVFPSYEKYVLPPEAEKMLLPGISREKLSLALMSEERMAEH